MFGKRVHPYRFPRPTLIFRADIFQKLLFVVDMCALQIFIIIIIIIICWSQENILKSQVQCPCETGTSDLR